MLEGGRFLLVGGRFLGVGSRFLKEGGNHLLLILLRVHLLLFEEVLLGVEEGGVLLLAGEGNPASEGTGLGGCVGTGCTLVQGYILCKILK